MSAAHSPAAVREALVTVLVHHLATGFDLTAAEIERIENQLTDLVLPWQDQSRVHLPAAIRNELSLHQVQRALDDRHASGRTHSSAGARPAFRAEWTGQVIQLIDLVYTLADSQRADLADQVDAALTELGLAADGTGRAAHHRPDQLITNPLWGSTSG
ncbi:hypothetical protein M8C13_38475 [Crossiella sp. SN42]|uniref:hypothetical protein n=1 Tax=Crossiella sp. SN42 TaxID=2944808 RepID=UPI00207D0D41|nr:hypothetical protein [Crossiella sp. SN42]MCO1581651.1 hypothetical protein [Crossiella sp. SN42]